ncbi:MAG TPA: serine hydrolase domain-containing protein, partial [Chloroflexota bacterium]|nr:serine hydrolase domain-containing protein [Chloroflexota bacterium]
MSTLASTTQLAPREIGASQLLLAKASMAIVLALAMLLSLAAPVVADNVSPGREPLTVASQRHGPTDPTELEAFLDQLLGTQMKENQIAGAAVSVVRAGQLLFAKGYGYADLAKGIPVDPEHTIFRTGSVGKTFTSTAVMQLVEQGKLDLDADVNTYLDFRIPNTYPQPITLKHLLTHTSGLENRLLASAVRDSRDLVPAREWLVSHMHARVRPPGVAAAYSNYNTMLAGYIVERVSGQPYDRYIQQHIFDPLGMTHSAASSQLPPDLRPHVSVGYASLGGVLQPFPEYIAQPAAVPAGGHHSSVIDMARYMIAHLENGRFGDAHIPEVRILKEATMQQMHSGLYAPHPRLLR